MTPDTLRRKLQKKMKHKPFRRCPKCGGRMTVVLVSDCLPIVGEQPILLKLCGTLRNHMSVKGGAIAGTSYRVVGDCAYGERSPGKA
jgi:hypothetical protein